MAFDFGLRQIGVATGNCLLGTTQPLPILTAKDGVPDWRVLEGLVDEWGPDLLVVGDPLNMDGSDSELSVTRPQIRAALARSTGPAGGHDRRAAEQLRSEAAISREQGHRGDFKQQPVDSYAAELILRTWLADQATP